MQSFQEGNDSTEERFSEIDERWSRVEDAIRIQTQERNQDLTDLHQQLRQHGKQTNSLENQKVKVLGQTLNKLQGESTDVKENLENLFDTEAEFRLQHIDKKNAFIQNYSQASAGFCKRLQQHSTNRIGDISSRLEAIDAGNRQKTEQTLKELKDELMGQAQELFGKEKQKYSSLLKKISQDSVKELDGLRTLLKTSQKQRQENEAKLKIMIENLLMELDKCCEEEVKEGEVTYDSLLKLLDESCDRIQEAQLR